ncbi:MAG: addiction module protein [Bryobacteraceae bacterium]
MTVKEELHEWVEGLTDQQALEILEDLRGLASSNGVPAWQKEEILRRRANLLASPETSLDWETVKREARGDGSRV